MGKIITKFGRVKTIRALVSRDIRIKLDRGIKPHKLGLYADGSCSSENLLLPNDDVPVECISEDLWGIDLDSCFSDEYDEWCINYSNAFDAYQLEWDRQVRRMIAEAVRKLEA
jgi:hypothetical protein